MNPQRGSFGQVRPRARVSARTRSATALAQFSGGRALSPDEHTAARRCHNQALLAKHRDSRADRVLGKPGLRHEFMNRWQPVAALQPPRADEAAEFVGELPVCRNLAQAMS